MSRKGEGASRPANNKQKGKGQAVGGSALLHQICQGHPYTSYGRVEPNQQLNFINKGIEVVSEEMRSGFVLAKETRFTEIEKMLWQYNTTLKALDKCMDIMDMSVMGITSDLDRTKQTVEAHAGHLMQNKVDIIQNQLQISSPPIQPASSSSSFPPMPAPTLALIAEAEEPNNNKAAQPKENESEMNCTTAIDQSTIADDSAPISNSVATVTDSNIPSRSTPVEDSALICNRSADVTDSITPSRPTASITNSVIATRLAASNESTVPTGVESILASPIVATGQLMDVNMTGPALPHTPDEIVP
ncbi:hypothetical protein C0989_011039 [Termitomyces sp. Mn162]|nr:hypothetical protein C0989_011039 [Termitomyces sp. Mn162]